MEDLGQDSTSHDIPTLLKLVQQQLEIDPTDETTKKLNEKIKRTLNHLGQVVIRVAEIRNLVGTGHGRTKNHDIDLNHALLIVNSVEAICPYLINLWQEKKKQNL